MSSGIIASGLVTVITPAIPRRVTTTLPRALMSVSAQTYPAPHLVRVDTFGDGPAANRNALLAGVTTKYVATLDDDDSLYTPHLEKLVRRAENSGAAVTYSACDGHVPRGVNRPFDAADLERGNYIPSCALIEVEELVAAGGWPEIFAEDWALWLLLSRSGARFEYVPDVTWTYHRGADGQQANRPATARRDVLDLVDGRSPR